jgi:F1F0 ATPase subunit 2
MINSMAIHISIAFTAGLFLGLFYFGTLWLTVQRLSRVRRPGILTLGGFFIRTGLTLLGFFVVISSHWERALACMLGFLLMRKLMAHRYGPVGKAPPQKQG